MVWAANHWQTAVDVHQLNHPDTQHVCQDLQQADWSAVPAHDMLLASPACQGHSPARGKDCPHHDATRSTAWAVVACAEYHRSPVVLVENVPAFSQWVLFPAWCDAMHRLGYAVAPHLVDAADHGCRSIEHGCFCSVPGRTTRCTSTWSPGRTGPSRMPSAGQQGTGATLSGQGAVSRR